MPTLEDQIVETWNIHHRLMCLMMDSIPVDAMSATLSKRGGRDIARQLAHIHNVRVQRLIAFAKKLGVNLEEFDSKISPPKDEIAEALELSGQLMSRYIKACLESEGNVSNFKRGVVPMMGYFISHESHHRGHLILTMKECGHKIPDTLKWGLWEWNKI